MFKQQLFNAFGTVLLRSSHFQDRWKGKVAVITGTASGIGEGLAKKFVREGLQKSDIEREPVTGDSLCLIVCLLKGLRVRCIGMYGSLVDTMNIGMKKYLLFNSKRVVGIDRNAYDNERLAKEFNCSPYPGKMHPIKADLLNQEDIESAFQTIKEKFGIIHILINNAGYATVNSLVDGNVDEWKTTLDINVLGLSIVTKEALKLMKVDDLSPHIVNICSLAGHRFFPGSNMYGASKHAVSCLTNVLRHDLKSSGRRIKVTSISPGVVNTNILDKKLMSQVPNMNVDDFVEVIVFALSAPPTIEIQEMFVDHADRHYTH